MFNQLSVVLIPSWRVGIFIALPMLSSAVLISSLALPVYITLLLLGLILGVSYFYIMLLSNLSHQESIITVQMADNSIILHTVAGNTIPVRLKENSFVSYWFCILKFETLKPADLGFFRQKRNYSVILSNHNIVDIDQLRRLRVLINFGSLAQHPAMTLD